MGRANREASAIFFDEDLSAQVVVTLEPETDYESVPLADAIAELGFRLSETKRDEDSGQPSERGELLLRKGQDVVFYSTESDDKKKAALCLSVGEGDDVDILLKGSDEEDQDKIIYRGLVIGDALAAMRSWCGTAPESSGAVSRSLALMLEKYPA